MKEVKLTLKINIDQDVYNTEIEQGCSDELILDAIKFSVNSAKIESPIIQDFEVDEIKEVNHDI